MTKKQELKNLLRNKLDFNRIQLEKDSNDFTKKMTPQQFSYNGIVTSHANYTLLKEVIEKVGYKHPTSDRTWLTATNVTKELIIENIK